MTPIVSLTILLDGEQTQIDIEAHRSVGDAIKSALLSFNMPEQDADACHLEDNGRLYWPDDGLNDLAGSGALLSLRLPL